MTEQQFKSLMSRAKTPHQRDLIRQARNKGMTLAEANELLYSGVVTAEARFMEKYNTDNLTAIARDRPLESINCTSRRGVYRKLKFGNGRWGTRRFNAEGFAENGKEAAK